MAFTNLPTGARADTSSIHGFDGMRLSILVYNCRLIPQMWPAYCVYDVRDVLRAAPSSSVPTPPVHVPASIGPCSFSSPF